MADSILRLRVEDKEYNASLKQARQGLLALQQALQQSGATFQHVDKATVEYARGLGRMETTAKTAKGRIGEMTSAFTDLRMQYKQLSDAEKNSPFGKAMNQSLNELRGRIQETKKQMSDVDNELKAAKVDTTDFSGVIGELGSKLGVSSELMGVLTTGTMGYAAAIGASVTAVIAATKAWVEYNDELNKQTNITTVTTGLSGTEADDLTIGVRALAETYDVDFREAINAANTLIQQFGVSGYDALSLLQDGMQGMIAGDGGKLLSMIQQYAPAFRDAGVSASQLVAVIHNSEGGLFTDQNMAAIVMGIKNIRLMTDNTSEALAKLGIDGEEMSRKLEDGSMTIFEALQQVAGKIDDVGSGSKAAGEVMQYVFGRQGAMAGTNLGEAIASLNTNLEETKTQTGELGESFAKLNDANVRLEATMQEVFGMTGWEDMNNLLKTELVETLLFTVDVIGRMKKAIHSLTQPMEDVLVKMDEIGKNNGFVNFMNKVISALGPLFDLRDVIHEINSMVGGSSGGSGGGKAFLNRVSGYIDDARTQENRKKYGYYEVTTDKSGKVLSATSHKANGETVDMTDFERKRRASTTPSTGGGGRGGRGGGGRGGRGGGGRGGGRASTPEKELTIQQQITKLEEEALTATDERRSEIAKTVQELDRVLEKQKKIKEELHKGNELPQAAEFADSDTRSPSERMKDSVLAAMSDKNAAVDETTMRTLMQTAITNGIDGIDWDTINRMMWEGMDIPDDVWEGVLAQINEKLAELDIKPIEINFSTGNVKKQAKEMNKDWQAAASAIQAVGSAMTAIEDPAAKVLGTIAQAVATMALSYSQASLATSNQGWGWIAFAATGLATMLSSIAAIKSATKGFANGGIVPGGSFSGDNLRTSDYGVNSGELILNRAQQDNIAAQLQGGGMQNLNLTATVTGEQIRLALNNTGRRTGNGEYLKFK